MTPVRLCQVVMFEKLWMETDRDGAGDLDLNEVSVVRCKIRICRNLEILEMLQQEFMY